MKNRMREVRLVRLVGAVSHCNCLRLVVALGVRLVRLVIAQVIEIYALGKGQNAAPRALYTTYIPGRLLRVARPGLEKGVTP